MLFRPVNYDEPVFRPPGEAFSTLLQVTLGCSWNKCSFCEMYTSKKFKVRQIEDVKADIQTLAAFNTGSRKVFLADGNAFVLSAKKLVTILTAINKTFGKLQRISSYALPKDILMKSNGELKDLRSLGLKLLYIGIETGDETLLSLIHKGETFNSTVDGILKAKEAGIESSIMIINGLGGRKYQEQHAVNSAAIINKVNPKFLSTLTLSLPFGMNHFKNRFEGDYEPLTLVELFKELKLFISNTNLDRVIYRSDHISNNLILKGTLSRDRREIIRSIDEAIRSAPAGVYPETPDRL